MNYDILKKRIIKRQYIYGFLFSFIGGFIVHIYKFTNYLPNSDGMYNFYSSQNMTQSGRWFLSFVCGFSSYYDLPWINGALSLVFISLSTVVILHIFRIEKIPIVLIVSGLMVVYPSVTEILCFEFTADGFMFSMLLSVLSVFILIKGNDSSHRIICTVISSVIICLSCGIYQAYVSFSIVLYLCFFIYSIFTYDLQKKYYLKSFLTLVVSVLVGLLLYFIIWKVCLFVTGQSATDYQGISQAGMLSISDYINSFKSLLINFFNLLFEKNVFKHGFSFYAILNILFLVSSLIAMIIIVCNKKLYKNRFKMFFLLLCVISIPIAVCMWQFVSTGVVYAIRMMHSFVIVYILVIVLVEKHITSFIRYGYILLNIIMILNLSVMANIAYNFLFFEYENSYSEAIELKIALNKARQDYGVNNIALIGNREKEVALDFSDHAMDTYIYTHLIEKSFLSDRIHTQEFMKNVLYYDGNFVDEKKHVELGETDSAKDLRPFFESGDIELINGTIVVKLG